MIYDPWPCEDAGHCLADQLRARLAEVYALCQRNFNLEDYYEIDANDVAAIIEGAAARGEGERLRARLAEVEAERDIGIAEVEAQRDKALADLTEMTAGYTTQMETISGLLPRLREIEARLADVLALCDEQSKETPCSCDPAYTERGLIAPDCAWHQDIESFVADVRAAAEGDDRG